MPVRSRYTPRNRRPREAPEPQAEPPFVSPVNQSAFEKTKNVITALGKYIQKNQDDHRRAGVTSIGDDAASFQSRVSGRAGDLGAEQMDDIRRSYRRDQDDKLLRDLQGSRRVHQDPPPCRRVEFVIDDNSRYPPQQAQAPRPPAKRKKAPEPKVIERIIYMPYPPKDERW